MKKSQLYIDESNILSETGHSAYVSIVVLRINKEYISTDILKIENELKIPYTHWVNMSWRLRVKFSEKIKDLDFAYKFILYDNPINQDYVLEDFLCKILKYEDNVNKIVIDGNKGKRYEEKLKKRLKSGGFAVNKIMFVDDKKEPLVRLADFMVGLIRSYVDDGNAYNVYIFNLLKHKIK